MFQTVDWEAQWRAHSPFYQEGKAQVPLSSFGGPEKTLLLEPGPGFGDLSHSTTELILSLMAPRVKGETIIDIGCGSGILSLAGLLMGAKSAIAIDIDPTALEHTRSNALLNGLDSHIFIARDLPKIPDNSLILINMIFSEQELVFAKYPYIKQFPILSSGLLDFQKDKYLSLFPNLKSQFQIVKDCWIAICLEKVFIQNEAHHE